MSSALLSSLRAGDHDGALAALYALDGAQSSLDRARDRACRTAGNLMKTFAPSGAAVLFSGPGRTEIGGNHTDHQHGRVLCGSVDMDMLACAAPKGKNVIRIQSEGYPALEVELEELAVTTNGLLLPQMASELKEAGVEYNVLTVVTGYLARHIQSVFSALCRGGFHFQQYIPCLDPLEGARGEQSYSLSPEEYEEFLKTLFDLWYRELEQGRYWSVRYFDNLVWMLRGHAPEQCSMRGCCSLQYLVEADGSVYPCDFYGLDQYRLGNILEHAWDELDRTREEIGFIEESRHVPERCKGCQWYPLCRNGCRRDRLAGEDGLGRNYYCDAYAGFFSYALPRLRRAGAMIGI